MLLYTCVCLHGRVGHLKDGQRAAALEGHMLLDQLLLGTGEVWEVRVDVGVEGGLGGVLGRGFGCT